MRVRERERERERESERARERESERARESERERKGERERVRSCSFALAYMPEGQRTSKRPVPNTPPKDRDYGGDSRAVSSPLAEFTSFVYDSVML